MRQDKAMVRYGWFILVISVISYLMIIGSLVQYNNSHGGGQQTLPGMDVVIVLLATGVAGLLILIQALLLRRISKTPSISILNFLITIPIIVLPSLCLKVAGLPAVYCNTVFVCLLVFNVAFLVSRKFNKNLAAGGALLLFIATLIVALGLYGKSESDYKWWDNGPQIIYNQDGRKIKEAENKKKGIVWGNYTEWDYKGRLTWFRRYPNGALQGPDSAVNYMRGEVWEQQYSFDSNGRHYERQNTFDMSSDTAHVRLLLVQQLVEKPGNYYCYTTWYTDTKSFREKIYTFDSIGKRYCRHIYFRKDGSISASETGPTNTDYVAGSTDALY